jgi:methylated-DNA-[protein]-cysteine S-methyltransferase
MRVTRHAYTVEGWGVGELWAAAGVVVAHEAPTARSGAREDSPPTGPPGAPTETLSRQPQQDGDGFVPDLVQRIHSFFRGARESFDDVPLDLDGWTPFQCAVADALRRVPWGDVVAYGELAEAAGYPRAGRAVGTFCARNPYFLLIPCHRVVGAAGIGPYGALGVPYKRRLLRLEGHAAL